MVLHSITALFLGVTGFIIYSFVKRVAEWRRLRHIPGPSLAGWTDAWLLRYVIPGTLCTKLIDVCNEYGKKPAS